MNVLIFLLLFLGGVFGDEVKSVSVMEGQSVTLNTDTELQTDDEILWWFGPEGALIAEINRKDNKIFIYNVDLDERFRDRLQVDHQTGSLTITNISTQHTGLYQVEIINSRKIKSFSVTVNDTHVVNDSMNNQTSSGLDTSSSTVMISVGVVGVVLVVTAVMIFCIYRKCREEDQDGQMSGEQYIMPNGFRAAAAQTDVMMTITDEEQEESFIRLDIEVNGPTNTNEHNGSCALKTDKTDQSVFKVVVKLLLSQFCVHLLQSGLGQTLS